MTKNGIEKKNFVFEFFTLKHKEIKIDQKKF